MSCFALLTWSFKNQNAVDKDILKAAGVTAGRCTLGIPGMARAKQLMSNYYMRKYKLKLMCLRQARAAKGCLTKLVQGIRLLKAAMQIM